MNTLLELIAKSPNVRTTFRSSRRPLMKGDTKVVRGETHYRQQVLTRDGYHVRNGRPVFAWVPIWKARVNQKWTKPLREIFEQTTSVTLDGGSLQRWSGRDGVFQMEGSVSRSTLWKVADSDPLTSNLKSTVT